VAADDEGKMDARLESLHEQNLMLAWMSCLAQVDYFAVGLVMIGLAGLLQWAKTRQPGVRGQPHAHHIA
jgi:hypothetical protein